MYAVLAHALAGPFDALGKPTNERPWSVSGVADGHGGGGDLMVAMGLWPFDDPPGCDPKVDCANRTGSAQEQAGTLMHEIGHNLGLGHAGLYRVPNCMPQHWSVMNYGYQVHLNDVAGN